MSSKPYFPSLSRRPRRKASLSSISSASTQQSVQHQSQPHEGRKVNPRLRSALRFHETKRVIHLSQPQQISSPTIRFDTTQRDGFTSFQPSQNYSIKNLNDRQELEADIPGDKSTIFTATRGVDSLSIPLDQSRRNTAIFIGTQADKASSAPGTNQFDMSAPAHRRDLSASSDMHRPVNKEDYLVARGANPRTGVVTPGSHSASSSLDNKSSQGRWRQRGDQWISLDLGPETPPVTPPKGRLPEPYRHGLRVPPKLVPDNRPSSRDEINRPMGRPGGLPSSPKPGRDSGATFHLLKHSQGTDIYPEVAGGATRPPAAQTQSTGEAAVRRKPVGSPPSQGQSDHCVEGSSVVDGSDETVLRRPRFEPELRSSSAPIPPRMRNTTPYNVDKDLPTLPRATGSSVLQEYQAIATQNPFLGPQQVATKDPSSNLSSTSGPPIPEKDLPCLPMSSGPSQSCQGPMLFEETMKEEHPVSPKNLGTPQLEMPKDPTEGDLQYPFVRTARQIHPSPQTKRSNGPLGVRAMPVPVYDNPPKHMSPPLMRVPLARAEGPRSMPAPGLPMPDRIRESRNLSLNTTITPTTTTMGRPGLPRQLRVGPRPPMPDARMMNHGRPSVPRRPPLPDMSGIFMNTGMNMSTDSIMPVPLPRVRPRAMSRPQMALRGDRMYGIPRMGPGHDRPNTTDMKMQMMWRDTQWEEGARKYRADRETNLVPPPLRPRLPEASHGGFAADDLDDIPADGGEEAATGLGLTRKCSRCHNGFVDVKRRNTDGVTLTSGPQNKDGEADEGSKKLHPAASSLPGLPEESEPEPNGIEHNITTTSTKIEGTGEESAHPVCCPDCCREENVHGGCLGHPSPSSTTSPAKSFWSDAQSPSSASETDEWEHTKAPKSNINPPRIVVTSQNPQKEGHSGPLNQGKVKTKGKRSADKSPFELSALPRTPATPSNDSPAQYSSSALAAAMCATGSPNQKVSGSGLHRRQRSSSSPVIGSVTPSKRPGVGQGVRVPSGSRLRLPTPAGLAISCAGLPKSRDVSGTSFATLELQIPGLGTFGGGALGEMVLVPFEASKMWIRNHPQVMNLGWDVLERGWHMGQTTTTTAWRLWAVIFVYSKTGKLKLNVAKGETAGGFVIDCARSALYLLVLAAAGAFAVRCLRIVLGLVGVVGWLFKAVFWVLKQVLGLGTVR
ncbi:hypothetical protein LTS15_000285 [Exophiala xenobiotica]|nr:hypothetical protein LTS15_000285 [Exophiala xenobiotica]